jgi:SAM-dependent methyltransferase
MRHPAKYSDALLPVFSVMLFDYNRVLDPFAGTGKLREVRPDAYLVEIEPEWARLSGATVADALCLPYDDNTFDAICTSPCYGNRMADSFDDKKPEKAYVRNTYKHALGRNLHPASSGKLQWGDKYREFHELAWRECARVLKENGRIVLNISDHIRDKRVQYVTLWHIDAIERLGFMVSQHEKISTPRNRLGANNQLRVDYESVIAFDRISFTGRT